MSNTIYSDFFKTNNSKNEILNHFDLVDIIKLLEFGTDFLINIIDENQNKRFKSDEFNKIKNDIKNITNNYNNLIVSYKILMN